jgi:hypothetical protein
LFLSTRNSFFGDLSRVSGILPHFSPFPSFLLPLSAFRQMPYFPASVPDFLPTKLVIKLIGCILKIAFY